MSKEQFVLEKEIWTDNDLLKMGWQDVQIWSTYADDLKEEYVLDLDYIFKWEEPNSNESNFSFWVSKATIVFDGVNGVTVSLSSKEGAVEVIRLCRENMSQDSKLHEFVFECAQGKISIKSTGFKMYVRSKPVLISGQYFTYQERGGISFDRKMVD